MSKPRKTVIAKTKSTRVEYGFAPAGEQQQPQPQQPVRVRESQREVKPLFGQRKKRPPQNDAESFARAITPEE